jgi:xylulokinase
MYLVTYDIGNSFIKATLTKIANSIEFVGATVVNTHSTTTLGGKGVEQSTEQWWDSICRSTKELLKNYGISSDQIKGISFCSQMNATVLVDENGNTVRPPMTFLDRRADKEFKDYFDHGFKIHGLNIWKLIKAMRHTCMVPVGAYSPIWKYKWVQNNEPENFARIDKFLDVGDYLLYKTTGRFVRTEDSAFCTALNDCRKGHSGWSHTMANAYGIKEKHLPEIVQSTDIVGRITATAAEQMGLEKGTPVIAGGGDVAMVAVGCGNIQNNQTSIYCGTSGSVCTVVDRIIQFADIMMIAVKGPDPKQKYLYGELETAGKCFAWARELIGKLDNSQYSYEECASLVSKAKPGAHGLMFTPFMNGCKTPFEDGDIRSTLSGISLETTRGDLLRAVIEGICFHFRWLLECQAKKCKISDTIRFAGGLARINIMNQILADVTGHTIETVKHPQYVGALGAAAVAAIGLGQMKFEDIHSYIEITNTYTPNPENHEIYNKLYKKFLDKVKSDRKLVKG